MGKVSGKAFRIVGLDRTKCRWVVEQDFRWNFLINFASLFAFFSDFPDKNVLILAWLVYFKDLSPLCKLDDKR